MIVLVIIAQRDEDDKDENQKQNEILTDSLSLATARQATVVTQ